MKPFRFGVQCIPKEQMDAGAWADLARRVEELGFDVLTVADHLEDPIAPVPALAAAAAATTTLRVGTLVSCNDFKHPVVTAKESAALDVLSGGRFELGLGAGWMRDEYEKAGLVFDRAGERIDRLSEAIDVIRALWSGEPTTVTGEHYAINGLKGTPVPVQRPGPPILIGGGSRKILTLAGRTADIVGLNFDLRGGAAGRLGPTVTDEATAEKLGWIAEGAGDRFDELELHVRIHACRVTDDREGTLARFASGLGMAPDEARSSPHVLCGDAHQIVDDLIERRERLGMSYVTVSLPALDSLAPVVARLAGA